MRAPVVYGMTWLAAVVLATIVGFTAINTVGNVLQGTGPLGADIGAPVAADDAAEEQVAPTVRRTLGYAAVDLVVECTGRVADLVSADPRPEWTMVEIEGGPDEDVDVELTSGDAVTSIEVYCNEGEPRPVVDEFVPGP